MTARCRLAALLLAHLITCTPVPAANSCKPADLRYNEVRQISAHNAYDSSGPKPNLQTQLDLRVRSFEFDLHFRPTLGLGRAVPDGEWAVFHGVRIFGWSPDSYYCTTLTQCLRTLTAWRTLVLANGGDHEVITLWLEIADAWDDADRHTPAGLDALLKRELGNALFSPHDLRCESASALQDRVRRCGWPRLADLRGKFIVVLQGHNRSARKYLDYAAKHEDAAAFTSADIKTAAALADPQWRNTIFFNIGLTDLPVARAVYEQGFVSRVWKIDTNAQWQQARADRAHHLATDYVLMQLRPPALDACGQPLEPIAYDEVRTGRTPPR